MAKKLLTSPRGLAVHPWLNKPDTKFKAGGQYKVGLKLLATDEKAMKLMKLIDDGMAQAVATARKENEGNAKILKKIKPCEDRPYQMETDEDDNETGYVIFNFKMTASGVSKKTGKPFEMRPALFDGHGQPLDSDTKVGGGSTIRVSFEIVEFFQVKIGAGVSLRLSGVQVIKLVEWGGGDASYHGFEEEDDADGLDSDDDADEDKDEDDDDDGDEDADDTDDDEEDEEEEDEEEEEEEEAPPPKTRKRTAKKEKVDF